MTDYSHAVISFEEMKRQVEYSEGITALNATNQEKAKHVVQLLDAVDYERLSRDDKGTVRHYLMFATGYTRSAIERQVAQYHERKGVPPAQESSLIVTAPRPVQRRSHGPLYVGVSLALMLAFAGVSMRQNAAVATHEACAIMVASESGSALQGAFSASIIGDTACTK
jgi:hypothetical protein